jgi:hypothetical protein
VILAVGKPPVVRGEGFQHFEPEQASSDGSWSELAALVVGSGRRPIHRVGVQLEDKLLAFHRELDRALALVDESESLKRQPSSGGGAIKQGSEHLTEAFGIE